MNLNIRAINNAGICSHLETGLRIHQIEIPSGIIPRIEIHKTHLDFIKENNSIKWIMIDINYVESLVKSGYTSKSFFGPKIHVITTTTIHDDQLAKYHIDREVGIIKIFKPDCHIPCDFPFYLSQSEKERMALLKRYQRNLSEFGERIDGYDVSIIPLIKSLTKTERSIMYEFIDKSDYDLFAFYASQYFGRWRGRRITELVNDVRTIISECSINKMLVIGLQSIEALKHLPPQITAVAGNRWIKESKLRTESIKISQATFTNWKLKAEKQLGYGQDIIHEYYD